MLFIKLLLAHLLGDFVFQPGAWVAHKNKNKIRSKYLYYHFLLHFVFLLILTKFDFKYIWLVVFISVSHFLIDCGKIYLSNAHNSKTLFFADQALHLIVLLVGSYYFEPFDFDVNYLYDDKIITLIALLAFTTYATSVILKFLLAGFNPVTNVSTTNNAGKYIGMLERLFIFFFVLSNYWEGIGFLLTAKSIFRFGDLKESKDIRLTEYILIGTLLSFAFGIGSAQLYKLLIHV